LLTQFDGRDSKGRAIKLSERKIVPSLKDFLLLGLDLQGILVRHINYKGLFLEDRPSPWNRSSYCFLMDDLDDTISMNHRIQASHLLDVVLLMRQNGEKEARYEIYKMVASNVQLGLISRLV
jgi:hypothetical protein